MNKVTKAIKACTSIIKKPSLLNHVIDDEGAWKKYVIKNYNLPDGLPVINISCFFNGNSETVNPYAYLDGATTPMDLALLKMLARKYKVENFFEIGTWRGESTANIATVVKNVVSLNLSRNDIIALTGDNEYADMHRIFSRGINNITHLDGNSMNFDFTNYLKKQDMVFIDGDHHNESIKKDTFTAFKLVKDDNSIIAWHDYAYEPETIRWSVLAGILDGCPKEKLKNLYHVSNTLCAVYLPDKYPIAKLEANKIPEKYFEITLRTVEMIKK